jgi:hypothetical protein
MQHQTTMSKLDARAQTLFQNTATSTLLGGTAGALVGLLLTRRYSLHLGCYAAGLSGGHAFFSTWRVFESERSTLKYTPEQLELFDALLRMVKVLNS